MKIYYHGEAYEWFGATCGPEANFFKNGDGVQGGFAYNSPAWFAAEHIIGCGNIVKAREKMIEEEAWQRNVQEDAEAADDFAAALKALEDMTVAP